MTKINDFLPFDIFPTTRYAKVGNERVGVIRFPEEGSLRASEDQLYQEMLVNQPDVFSEVAKIAVAIATAEQIKPSEAYKAITEMQSEEFADIRIKYADKIVELNSSLSRLTKAQQLAAVTAIMPRLADVVAQGGSNLASTTNDQQVALFANWSMEQTLQLSGGLVEEIYKFFQKEANRGREPGGEVLSDEDIKKPPAEDSASPEPTGQTSTGASNGTGPMNKDSEPVASVGAL